MVDHFPCPSNHGKCKEKKNFLCYCPDFIFHNHELPFPEVLKYTFSSALEYPKFLEITEKKTKEFMKSALQFIYYPEGFYIIEKS